MKSYKMNDEDEMLITELVENIHRKLGMMAQGESMELKIRRVV